MLNGLCALVNFLLYTIFNNGEEIRQKETPGSPETLQKSQNLVEIFHYPRRKLTFQGLLQQTIKLAQRRV